MNSGSMGGPASGSGRRWRRLAILCLALISFGAAEALGVGLYYEVQKVRLKDWASRNGDPDMVQYPAYDEPPCPNRMQAPTCLAAAAAANAPVPDSDRDAVLDLLVIRRADGSSPTPSPSGPPETESFEAAKTPEAP
jgi:hypothetical protein